MLKDYAKEFFIDKDFNCAETTLMAASKFYGLGLTEEDMKLVSACGGGMGCGKACGVLCGALAVYGKLAVSERAHATPEFGAKCKKLYDAFETALTDTQCDVLKPMYKAPEVRCLKTVELGLDVLEKFIDEEGLGK